MQKQAPTVGRLLVMVGFSLSCFGLILFLWVAFGGPVPFAAKGYQVRVDFANAGQLATQADVRISGVPVGKVQTLKLGPGNSTSATLQIDPRYAPIPRDTRAILRTKTLLGETYVELTPGNRATGAPLPDGALLPERQVREKTTIDQIFQTFDEPTRKAFSQWQQSAAASYAGRGGDINNGFGNLPAFTESADQTLAVLNAQGEAVQKLVRDTGTVFGALSARGNQLRELITNSNTVFATTAKRNQQLAETFQILPTFEREGTATVKALQAFAVSADPLVLQLQPAAEQLSPLLVAAGQFATPLNQVTSTLDPLTTASKTGVPALGKFLIGDPAHPERASLIAVLGQLNPFLQQLNPVLNMIGIYKHELAAFVGNTASATQAVTTGFNPDEDSHYLRISTPINITSLAAMPHRPSTSRTNPYIAPGTNPTQLTGYETRQCGLGFNPPAPTTAPYTLPYRDSAADITTWLKNILYGGGSTPRAPACSQQLPGAIDGGVKPTSYPTLFPLVEQEP